MIIFQGWSIVCNYQVYCRQRSQRREQGSLRIFERCQNILETSVMRTLFKMSRLCPMVGDAPAHMYRCVLLWTVETKNWLEKDIVSEHERLSVNTIEQSMWLKKSGTCSLLVLSHTGARTWELYTTWQRSSVLMKSIQEESYKNTFKKLPVILGL